MRMDRRGMEAQHTLRTGGNGSRPAVAPGTGCNGFIPAWPEAVGWEERPVPRRRGQVAG